MSDDLVTDTDSVDECLLDYLEEFTESSLMSRAQCAERLSRDASARYKPASDDSDEGVLVHPGCHWEECRRVEATQHALHTGAAESLRVRPQIFTKLYDSPNSPSAILSG